MLADLEPKVGLRGRLLQQIELAAVENTRALEVALLARSNASMDEGTKAPKQPS